MGGCRPLQCSPPGLRFRAHEDMPQNAVAAASGLKTFNLIPAVGEPRAPVLPLGPRESMGEFKFYTYHSLSSWAALGSGHPPPASPQLVQTEHRENAILTERL